MKIAIAGYGAEGQSSYRYFANMGHDVTIVDERPALDDLPPHAATILGEGAFSQLQSFEVVLRTPGLDPARIVTNGTIWSATNEFFTKCPAPIIGVTGSKGKGTTCALIAAMLRAQGKTVHLVGNIGVPALDVLGSVSPSDIVVYELSSFQLWDSVRSPQVAVITHIEPDHLDVHHGFDDYLQAKARIRRLQSTQDICFYAADSEYAQQIIDMPALYEQTVPQARDWRFRAFRFGVPNTRDDTVPAAYVEKGVIHVHRPGQERITAIQTDIVQLPGEHNLMNICAAICAALMFGVSDEAIRAGITSFRGLPHRLKRIRTYNDVTYYDDSIATTPGSSIAAIKAFEEPKVLIVGGSSKGATYDELAATAAGGGVRSAIIMGDEASAIEAAFTAHNVVTLNVGVSLTMAAIVDVATKQAQPGDIVILSPACASFGMFKNYSDRGDQYIAAVEALGV